MSSSTRVLLLSCALVWACACDTPPGPPEIDIDFNETDEGRVAILPRLDDPFSIEETRDLRAGFDWSTTEALPVTDPDGRPALRYAIAFIKNDDERAVLDALGPHEPLPMFEAERMRWAGQVGRFGFFGDGEGLFHFVILPASTYNTVRELALEGRAPLEAVILRDVPVAEARNEDGSIDYQWLGERGFRMNETPAAPRATSGDGAEARVEPFLIEFLLLIAGSRDARDAVDDALAEINAAGREGENYVYVALGSTDPNFPSVVQAWGTNPARGFVAGDPLQLRDIEVIAQREIGATRGRTNRFGIATVSVAVGASVTFCVRAQNFAVQVDEGLEATQQCNFRNSTGVTLGQAVDEAIVNLTVTDPVWNIVAQFTDSHDYARRVMGYNVTHRASVLIGAFADIFGAFNENRAFTLCGSYTSLINFQWAFAADTISALIGSPGAFLVQAIVSKIMAHDVIFPDHGNPMSSPTEVGGTWSRGVSTHEYGHFVQCDMMSSLGGDGDFTEGWGDVIFTTLAFGGMPPPTAESLFMTEGIADYFAAQVSGGVNYFQTVPGSGAAALPMWMPDPGSSAALEDNVGGMTQVVTLAQLSGPRPPDPFIQSLATVTTLLTDASDGARRPLPDSVSDFTSWGAFFVRNPIFQFEPGTSVSTYTTDEEVALSGRMLPDVFREMSTLGNTLNQRNFFGALARVSRREFSDAAVCNMFALHSPDGLCTTVVSEHDVMGAPIVPSIPIITFGAIMPPNDGRWSWRDISSVATGFVLEVVDDVGTRLVPSTARPYPVTRTDTFTRSGLPFDQRLTFRVATTNGTAMSGFAEHSVHTFAEAVPSLDGTALRGGARLTWPAVRATSYSVHDVTGGADVTVATTTSAEMTLTGLAGGVPRTYHVVAHNAVGVPTSPSPSVTVTPLAPVVVYVAPFGDDSSPSAGAASSPFRTVAAAIASATASGADEVVLHEGIYSERGPITVDGNLTVRGGFRFAAGAWTDVGGASRVDIDIVGRTGAVACGTASFNSTGRLVVPALLVSPGGRLTLVSLEVTATSAGSGDCYAVVLASDAPLRLDDVQLGVQATGASTCSAGAVGVLGALIEIEGSNVVGARFSGASLPTNLDAAGLVACDGPGVHVSHSTLAGVSAPALVTSTAVGALVGFAARGASDVHIQRSWVEATRNEYDWDAASGRLAGMEVTASGRVFVANSIVRTPHGGTLNRAIEVGGPRPGSLGALQLYHVTAAVGDDWSVTRAVPPDHRAAALFFTGDIRDVSVHNNLLLLAGGSVNGVNYTGLDRFQTTVDPVNLRVTGNLFSVPYTSPFVLATLMQCAATEELGSWYDEASLNTPRAHECHGGSTDSWVASGNRAFTFPLGAHPRAVVDVDLDAYPVTPTRVYSGSPPPVPLASEVATDIADLPRNAPVGAGAWAER